MSCDPFGHGVAVSGWGFGYSVRFSRLRISGISLSCYSFFVPFLSPLARLPRDPNSRVLRAGACPCRRALRAGAVCAPDCARARAHASVSAGRTSPVSSFWMLFSRRRRREERLRPRRYRFPSPPHIGVCTENFNPIIGLISHFLNRKFLHGLALACLSVFRKTRGGLPHPGKCAPASSPAAEVLSIRPQRK